MSLIKSSTTAGLLGVFLGCVGAHDWYLGNRKKGTTHLVLFIVGFVLTAVSSILEFQSVASSLPQMASWSKLIGIWGFVVSGANAAWSLIEGIIILARGDAGLAREGYAVAVPTQSAPIQPTSNASTSTITTQPTSNSFASTTTSQVIHSSAQLPAPQAPLSRKTKKRLIIGLCFGVGAVLIAISAAIVITSLSQVNYSETYRLAKDLKPKVYNLYQGSDCHRVISYANLPRVSNKTYEDYIENCKREVSEINVLIDKISATSALERDPDLTARFDRFREAYATAVPTTEVLVSQLALYKSWHTYNIRLEELSTESPDTAFQEAAAILKDSGNEDLSNYATGWLEKTLPYIHAYQAYNAASATDPALGSLRTEMLTRQSEQREWISRNLPDIVELSGFDLADTMNVYNQFRLFYNAITTSYEANYNSSSGDCSEAGGLVHCS